ncbi:MAG: diacylglycerol kinase family lipid kinase, partial [Parasporobacterium sp.]|nr:diacylglycerol kinase family lipid kinase [Parasporobacterium sp.]
ASIKDAARVAVNGELFSTDIGHFNNTYFTYVASLGKLSAVSCFTPQDVKKRWGHMAYVVEGIKVLLHLDAYDLKITYLDGDSNEKTIEDNYFLGMITNTTSVGGFSGITGNNVDLHDGLFEVVLCKRPKSLGQFSLLVNNMFLAADKDSNNEMVTKFKTSQIKIESKDEVQWVIDGENAGKHKVVEIENDNRAIEIKIKKTEENT